jgi:hypothetical protein
MTFLKSWKYIIEDRIWFCSSVAHTDLTITIFMKHLLRCLRSGALRNMFGETGHHRYLPSFFMGSDLSGMHRNKTFQPNSYTEFTFFPSVVCFLFSFNLNPLDSCYIFTFSTWLTIVWTPFIDCLLFPAVLQCHHDYVLEFTNTWICNCSLICLFLYLCYIILIIVG